MPTVQPTCLVKARVNTGRGSRNVWVASRGRSQLGLAQLARTAAKLSIAATPIDQELAVRGGQRRVSRFPAGRAVAIPLALLRWLVYGAFAADTASSDGRSYGNRSVAKFVSSPRSSVNVTMHLT